MSKLDSISTQIEFHGSQGEDLIALLESNYLMHEAIWKMSRQYVNAKVAIHTSPRLEQFGPVEWSMSVTSPAGRLTYAVSQRTPSGSVSFQPG